ncbi:MAG: DUF3298 domain-containing protein [Janthinobacterium lividum]
MRSPLFALALLCGLAACQSQTNQTTTTSPSPTPGQAFAGPGQPTNSPGATYQVYRALLPGQADSITLHLVAAPSAFAAGKATAYFGSYYGTNGHPYMLGSQPTTADSVVLFDTSSEQAVSPDSGNRNWRLHRQPGRSNLAGTVGGQPVRLRLMPPMAGTLTFAVRCFADSAAAFPQEAKSPHGHFSLQALAPLGGAAVVRQALEISLLRDLRGDSLDGLPTLPLPAFYKQQRQAFFQTYREDAADSRPAPADTAGIGPYGPGMRYENQTATYVLYQQGNLLSVGFFHYDFSGGAHGNYGTTAASYDLRTGHRLRYADIFRPTAETQLSALLGRAVRPLVGLAASDPLDKQLFVKEMPVTHNVFLTAGGAVFIYQPYEIAAYAEGEVRVFVPLAALRALLREGLPLPAPGSVAKR